MKVWIVKTDRADRYAGAADWEIVKVFASEHEAREFAKADINREVEDHEVIPSQPPTSVCRQGRHTFRHAHDRCECGEVTLNYPLDIQ